MRIDNHTNAIEAKKRGSLLNEGTLRQPIYVPAPGYFGTNSIGG